MSENEFKEVRGMTENEFKERFPDFKKYKPSGIGNGISIDTLREVRDIEEVEKLVKENWILINTYTNIQGFAVLLGSKG